MIGGIRSGDRVAVLGARGWFGSTLVKMLPPGVPTLNTASTADERCETWSFSRLREFEPTVVANFAFLTRERVDVEGLAEFTRINQMLIDQYEQTAGLPSVRAVVTVSSGAAVTEPSAPYGSLKLREEQVAQSLATDGRASVILRAYSVSGPEVRRPRDYAFSDFILQVSEGSISIRSSQGVYRRYVSVRDALAVALESAAQGWSGVVETGGDLVEMGELAERVVSVVNPGATIVRPPVNHEEVLVYASDDTSWSSACARLGYVPMDLDEQIRQTARGLLGMEPGIGGRRG